MLWYAVHCGLKMSKRAERKNACREGEGEGEVGRGVADFVKLAMIPVQGTFWGLAPPDNLKIWVRNRGYF